MILTIGAIVRSFASLIMPNDMNATRKRVCVIVGAVVLYMLEVYVSIPAGAVVTSAALFGSLLEGLAAGMTALGIYHATDSGVQG